MSVIICLCFIVLSKIVRLPVTHVPQHYQNNVFGGWLLEAVNVLGA